MSYWSRSIGGNRFRRSASKYASAADSATRKPQVKLTSNRREPSLAMFWRGACRAVSATLAVVEFDARATARQPKDRSAHAKDARLADRRAYPAIAGCAYSQPQCICRTWWHAEPQDGRAGCDLHRTVDSSDRSPSLWPRRRRQRLVFPPGGRSLALAAVKPPDRRREDLGGSEAAQSRLHVRQYVLVVQYVLHRGHKCDAAADVSGRWAQNSRSLCRAAGVARRAQPAPRQLPPVQLLGANDHARVEPVDCARYLPRPQDTPADAHALLPSASRLRLAEMGTEPA